MTNKLFDSFVKDKLHNYESPVPEGLWEKIIDEEDRKPIAFWWWNKNILATGLVLLSMAFGYGYFAFHHNASNTSLSNKSIENKSITTISQNVMLRNKLHLNNENHTSNCNQLSVNGSITCRKIENIAIESTDKATNNSNHNSTKLTEVENDDLHKNLKLDKKTIALDEGNAINHNHQKLKLANKANEAAERFNNAIETAQLAESFSLSSKLFTSGNIATNENNLYDIKSLKDKTIAPIGKLFSDECPTTKGTYRNDFYVEGYISPDFSFKNVNSTVSGNETYMQKKDSSESMRLGFTIGARFSKSLSNNLLLKAGLQYSQFNEKFTLRTENDRRQTIVINTRTIVRPGQSDTTVSDTSVFVQIGYRIRSNINRYKNLEIPVMLSYEMGEPESKWKFALNAGAIVNITSWYEGKTLDASYNLVNINDKSSNGAYQNKIGVSLYGGVSIIRSITNNLDVFAEPYFRYGLLNSVQSNVGFNQKFNVAGLQFGARLKLSKNKHL